LEIKKYQVYNLEKNIELGGVFLHGRLDPIKLHCLQKRKKEKAVCAKERKKNTIKPIS